VLHGGRSWNPIGDTWTWDGQDWRLREPEHRPGRRAYHVLGSHAVRGTVVLHGGHIPGLYLYDTWEWDGEGWEQSFSDSGPPARHSSQMVSDGLRGSLVLFGGVDDTGPLGGTWERRGQEWRALAPEAAPPARRDHALAYDASSSGVVVFGGRDADGQPLGDTWTLSSGRDDRPAQRLVVDLPSAGRAPDSDLLSLTATFQAGGTGVLDGEPVTGARLLAWSTAVGGWQAVVSNDDGVGPDDLPDLLRWTTDSPAEIGRLLFQDRIHLAVTPLGTNGGGRAEVATDHVEVVVRYRLP